MARLNSFVLIAVLFTFFLIPADSIGQSRSYELIPAPDLWYNDVDGIRVGVRLKGQVPGTFEDGPHRLDGGVWLSTWFPDLPVSYYLSYINPIDRWSDFGSEANYQLISSIRTGYYRHGIALNKRWQEGFDERRYREVHFFNSLERRFDLEYTAFPNLWSDRTKLKSTLSAEVKNDNGLGWYRFNAAAMVQYLDDSFVQIRGEFRQDIPLHEYWGFKVRLFTGISSENTAPEYLFSRSKAPAHETIFNGVTRAKGTIPQPWMESGNFQISGGANLRGYAWQDINSFYSNNPDEFVVPFLLNSIAAVNAEFDYYNPIGVAFNRIPYAGDFLSFRSYLFFDAGRSLQVIDDEPDTLFADAGAGFSLSLNIPDYLGKPRGFVLKYEIPFWLSEPGTEEEFKLRHLLSFGAVITF
ncbi:BamA/TamA family outer membrane protein [Rhodohalobacter halophilus]|uniref:hypothetical protein n=1 Tax=Rhodohalobacter halophilus TaxID=1812810 RepID=UPI00083F7531|nr:hypothetical protein [Rhodohalobacter halophilus]